jgi:hypothetical protein
VRRRREETHAHGGVVEVRYLFSLGRHDAEVGVSKSRMPLKPSSALKKTLRPAMPARFIDTACSAGGSACVF